MDRQKALGAALQGMNYKENVPMRELTTFRVGGPADMVLFPKNGVEAAAGIAAARTLMLPYHIIGNGSNLLVLDGGVRGLVIAIGEAMSAVTHDGCIWTAEAGCSLTALARQTVQAGFTGLEWAAGIPGTLGGALAMNAGAYGGEMKDVVVCVTVLEGEERITRPVEPGDFGYRTSRFSAPERVALSASLQLAPDDGGAADKMAEFLSRRREKQPLSYPSAGSTFRRPIGYFAGKLIEDAGLKGFTIGGAMVSEKHAGFVINRGGATARDILMVIDEVRQRVRARSEVELQLEIRVLGEP